MRLWTLAMAGALIAGCGGSGPKHENDNAAAGEVTVSLPPALPVATPEPTAPAEPEAPPEPDTPPPPKETPVAVPKARPEAPPASETPPPADDPPAEAAESKTEPAEPAAEAHPLPEASPPIAAEGLAGYIRGAGFECDRVVATRRAAGGGPYKFDCAAGGSYRGTIKRGRLYFRPWQGGTRD